MDLVTLHADIASSQITISFGNADGTFSDSGSSFSIAGNFTSLVLGDFSGNGFQDIVVANGAEIQTFTNNGDGSFSDAVVISNPLASAQSLVAGDFDNDGNLDLAVGGGTAGTGQIAIFSNNGDGQLTLDSTLTLPGTVRVMQLIIGDLNQDGQLDLIAGSTALAGGSVQTYFGDGSGGFEGAASYATSFFGNASSVALGDLNGDGILDLAVGSIDDANINIRYGNADGSFGANNVMAMGSTSNSVLQLADLNGDGILDLIGTGGGRTQISLGLGDGSFNTTESTGMGITRFSLADFNGDGVLDIAGQTSTLNPNRLFLADTNSGVSPLLEFSFETMAEARDAFGILKNKQRQIAEQRGILGAFQSRIGTALNTLQATVENYAAARSRIVDADIAAETSELTRLQILRNASAAVLAQANQQPALATQLLSGS